MSGNDTELVIRCSELIARRGYESARETLSKHKFSQNKIKLDAHETMQNRKQLKLFVLNETKVRDTQRAIEGDKKGQITMCLSLLGQSYEGALLVHRE